MKCSNYNIEIDLNDAEEMIYNIFSRKYFIYQKSNKKELNENILDNLNRKQYTYEQAEIIKELYKKGIVIDDRIDEIEQLDYKEKKEAYSDSVFNITVYTTNACNFRCTYCTQSHTVSHITDETTDRLIELIKKLSIIKRTININWFGGEPLLQYDRMVEILEKTYNICEENKCKLTSSIVTNGYLLSEDRANKLRKLGLMSAQITVDGNKNLHNSRRVLASGEGTYDEVIAGIENASKAGIAVILRMNINKENLNYQSEVLDSISEELRKNIYVSIANIFQETEKVSAFEILKKAFDKGYLHSSRYNSYSGCTTCGHNTLAVNTNGDILFCTNCEDDPAIGKLLAGGIVQYKNKDLYHQQIKNTKLNIEECRNCKELPLCINSCRYWLAFNNSGKCSGKRGDGMSVEEIAYLDYYYDSIHTANKGR